MIRLYNPENKISIHALLAEGDSRSGGFVPNAYISIHALLAEGDDTFNVDTAAIIHFYPRPPRGGRPTRYMAESSCKKISIHALLAEGDAWLRPSGLC